MSSSGVGPFENDSALDLVDEIRGLSGDAVLNALREALIAAIDVEPGDYLDRDLGEPAVAASALVLAKAQSREDVLERLELAAILPRVPITLVALVTPALDRVMQDDSEVYGLWLDVGRGEEWKAGVRRLLTQAR
ncbi:DUF4259 domain-containing protein [Actinocatenispora sera]|uniref:DUF4259 domain-containing protein n=1 Tax=Actinocatenispora sera TaxID=390989 RepID=UPI0033CFF796